MKVQEKEPLSPQKGSVTDVTLPFVFSSYFNSQVYLSMLLLFYKSS